MTVATAPERGLIPFYPIWELQLYKSGKYWAFDLPQYGVYEELLCGGTELVLDQYFEHINGRLPFENDVMNVRLYNGDEVTPELFTTKLTRPRPDPCDFDSTYYYDTGTDMTVWFCPFLLTLWDSAPTVIYIDF